MLRSDIRFLGVGGSKSADVGTTCVQVSYDTLIDGGNIISILKNDAKFIENIFLTHSHLDHISDIPYLLDINFESMKKPLKIYALKETINILKNSIFNNDIWPDFTKIKLLHSQEVALEFIEIEFDKAYKLQDVVLTPVEVNHTVPTCGYIIEKDYFTTLFVPDTYLCENISTVISQKNIDSLIVDCSYPSRMRELAKSSKHLTPSLLKEQLDGLDIDIYITHIKSNYKEQVEKEISELDLLKGNSRILRDGEYLSDPDFEEYENSTVDFIKLISKEKDLDTILKSILIEAVKMSNSDGGTIYLKENDSLKFKTVINQKLGVFSSDIDWPNVPLLLDGEENTTNVSALCAVKKKIINIEDVYESTEFNFEGTKVFDKKNNYRSKSMLLIPLTDQDDEVIGVLQLINKNNFVQIKPYTKKDEKDIEAYGAYAATAIAKNELIDNLENLLLSFIQSISFAINKKSEYGYRHIKNVQKLMDLTVFSINRDNTVYKDKYFDSDQQKELSISALIHDIGKIVTPDYVLDKSTRLETIYDRISEVKERFTNAINSLKIDELKLENAYLKGEVDVDIDRVKEAYSKEIRVLVDEYNYIKEINHPAKTLDNSDIEKIEKIAKKIYQSDMGSITLLTKDEVKNLSVKRGNLTDEERELINNHARVGYEMLGHLKFPKKYEKIPQIAGFHHEKLNGTGYPFGLSEDEIGFEVRMLTICDIFEALTSSDRPYKRAKSKDEAFKIMDFMASDNEIDKQLFDFLKTTGIFDSYLDETHFQSKSEFLEYA